MGGRRSRSTWKTRLAGGAASGAVGVALLMALSSVAAATTIHAPFKGIVSADYQYTDSAGCATGAITSPINWSSTTGVVTMAVKADAKACTKVLAGVGTDSYGSASAELEIAIPIHINTSTTHSIVVHWRLHDSVSSSFVAGTCGPKSTTVTFWYCDRYSDFDLFVESWLVDTTNGSYFYGTYYEHYNESYNDSELYSGKYYNSSGGYAYGVPIANVSTFVNTTTLNRADSYALVSVISINSGAEIYSYQAKVTGASLAASVSVAGGSNKATFGPIVVT